MLFVQLATEAAEREHPDKVGLAVSMATVEVLPTVVIVWTDEVRTGAQCMVSKDGIEAREGSMRLLCVHL
jgi:hypothetical protein